MPNLNMPSNRTRAVRVCEYCHSHKIRCDLDTKHDECSNCSERGELCKIRTRKLYSSRVRTARRDNDIEHVNHEEGLEGAPTPTGSTVNPVELVATCFPAPSSRVIPIFVGNGDYGAIISSTAKTNERHFHVPVPAENTLAPEDLQYLKLKGCFTLPPESSELITAYFRFVHPIFPVIDGTSFLHEYNAHGVSGVNLLLLWSMFSVSASFIPTLDRKQCKVKYSYRAKLLFDLSEERDKIVLIQSALLLSFWFADFEDVKQSWYWTGVAFAIGQTLGMHRDAKQVLGTTGSERSSALWRIVWKCCMIRDVWLAFTMGRPIRINSADCDPFPREDPSIHFKDLTLHGEVLYTPEEAVKIGRLWQSFCTAADVLRESSTKILSPSRVKLLKLRLEDEIKVTTSADFTHISWHCRLHHYVALIALARNSKAQGDIRNLSDSITATIQEYSAESPLIMPAPFIIPLVVPALISYFHGLSSADPGKMEAYGQIDILLSFFDANKDNYPAAGNLHRVFTTWRNTMQAQTTSLPARDVLHSIPTNQMQFPENSPWFGSQLSWPGQGSSPASNGSSDIQ
ncbi:unnamed protein product [Periconia digitata]|uniref:Zn(2)-C6 fungal-type domain-containing protein n=1 Tax=Periconia digitata TaxID=1303443 RepID=A0A9W4XQZ4_9PLEO|nr:unnamed protein product [Periconia digitata]